MQRDARAPTPLVAATSGASLQAHRHRRQRRVHPSCVHVKIENNQGGRQPRCLQRDAQAPTPLVAAASGANLHTSSQSRRVHLSCVHVKLNEIREVACSRATCNARRMRSYLARRYKRLKPASVQASLQSRRVHVTACTLILRNARGEHAAAAHLCPQGAVHTSI